MATRLILINALIRIASAASGQLFAFVIADRMGAHPATASLVAGVIGLAFYATELTGAPVAGHLADRLGQLRVLRWGPLFGIAAVLLGALAALAIPSVTLLAAVLVLARLAEGSSAACAVPTTLVLLARHTAGHEGDSAARRLRLMGLFEIASLGGLIIGYLLAGVSWDRLAGISFLLLPAVYLVAWFLARGREPSVTSSRQASSWATLVSLVRRRGVRGFTVAWLAVNAVVGVWLQQAPVLLKLPTRSHTQSLVGGFSGRTIGVVFAAWGLTFLIGIAVWSVLAPRWPRRRTLTVALAGMLGVVASLAAVNHGAPTRGLLIVAAVMVMVESGFTPAAFAHLADVTDAYVHARGSAMGLYSLLLGVGQLAGAIIGAPFAARWQMDGVLIATAMLAILALAGVSQMDAHATERRSAPS